MKKDVYKDVEYFEIVSRGKVQFRLDADEINGKTKSEIELLVGESLGEGYKNYVLKKIGEPKNMVGKIRGRLRNPNKNKQNNSDMDIKETNERLNKLEVLISQSVKNSPDTESLLDMQRKTMQLQIDFYKSITEQQEKRIVKLEKEINESGGNSNMDMILNLASAFLKKPVAVNQGLADQTEPAALNDVNDIPGEFMQALNRIDFNQISAEQRQKVLGYFNQFANHLPLKDKG